MAAVTILYPIYFTVDKCSQIKLFLRKTTLHCYYAESSNLTGCWKDIIGFDSYTFGDRKPKPWHGF